jgi:hypothetical protein
MEYEYPSSCSMEHNKGEVLHLHVFWVPSVQGSGGSGWGCAIRLPILKKQKKSRNENKTEYLFSPLMTIPGINLLGSSIDIKVVLIFTSRKVQ